jgi:hypothetical protein
MSNFGSSQWMIFLKFEFQAKAVFATAYIFTNTQNRLEGQNKQFLNK